MYSADLTSLGSNKIDVRVFSDNCCYSTTYSGHIVTLWTFWECFIDLPLVVEAAVTIDWQVVQLWIRHKNGSDKTLWRHMEPMNIKVLEQHMLPSIWRLFQGRPSVFQQDNAKPHTAAITTAFLRSRRVWVLNWPACSRDLSPIENIWSIIKWKIRQRGPRILQQLETYFRQEWDQIPTPKLQKRITSIPRHLQAVLKRRGDATPW